MLSLTTSRAFRLGWVQSRRRRVVINTGRLLASSSSSDSNTQNISIPPSPPPPPMANLYQGWSLEQDQLLWKASLDEEKKSSAELAALLGRGIRGVQARLSKLQDVTSPAYERLFAANDEELSSKSSTKLVPVSEVLQRIQWDYMLDAADFSFLHYDRLEDTIIESPMEAPNQNIAGSETLLAKALPEHRIVGIKYKERIVWDRPTKLDLVFRDPGIYHILETYDEWKQERDQAQAWNRQRQSIVTQRIRQILGLEKYEQLQTMSSELEEDSIDPTLSVQSEVEEYVQRALELLRQVRRDPSNSLDPTLIPMSDILALEDFSELVAVLPDTELRSTILAQVSLVMDRLEGKNNNNNNNNNNLQQTQNKIDPKLLLKDEDLTETFVRGSGPGGQKINKTSNRVVLVHEPTQLKVECQDTRSLQQNRKIARTRLLEKLDEHWNGSQSKLSMKHKKASQKRQKSKTKNRARQRTKQLEKQEQQQNQGEEEEGTASDDTDF